MRALHRAEPKCMRHRVHGQQRVSGWKRVYGTIEKEQAELATCSACITWGGAEVCASRSSRSVKSSRLEKSSQYNRKRASGVRHTECVRHIGCSSEAASGNVVNFS